MKRAMAVILLFLLAASSTLVAHSFPAQAQVLPSQVQLVVTKVEMQPSPLPATAPATATASTEELFVYAKVTDTNAADVLRFSPNDLVLSDTYGNLHYSESYDGPSKLSSKDLIANSPASPAVTNGWLRYTVSIDAARAMKLEYVQTQQTAQGASNKVVIASHQVTAPAKPTAYRVYATQAQPALRTYMLDEALVAGYLALTVDPLYEQGGTTATPRVDRARVARQAATLDADHKAFDAVTAPDRASQDYRAQADAAFDAVQKDLAAVSSLRTAQQWAQWQAQFNQDNQALAALYQTWPSVTATS